MVALIPARSGSKRVPDKNVRLLNGKPLIAYTIEPALTSKVFKRVIVSTDSSEYADVAKSYGAEVLMRPSALAGDRSPDIEWVRHVLENAVEAECFSILRPTSPFRKPATIHRAWDQFMGDPEIDSIRAVELCGQHPGKMWTLEENRLLPLLAQPQDEQPWHSRQYADLPQVYVQNASLEMAWRNVVFEKGTIAGDAIAPFFTEGLEGFDINIETDWWLAERLLLDRS